jgi:hypothetical protein
MFFMVCYYVPSFRTSGRLVLLLTDNGYCLNTFLLGYIKLATIKPSCFVLFETNVYLFLWVRSLFFLHADIRICVGIALVLFILAKYPKHAVTKHTLIKPSCMPYFKHRCISFYVPRFFKRLTSTYG